MIHSKRVCALVPIKDHSERVKGKNFRDFGGRPLYHHILATLDRVYAVDEILVNTDSERVMQEAPGLSPKIRVVVRPEEIRGDFVSMNMVIAHDLTQSTADIFLQTHATNPLLKAETIADCLRSFVADEQHDSLFSVNAHYSRFYLKDGTPVNHDPEKLLRTQDLDPLYEENSSLYVFTQESFAATGRRIGKTPLMAPIPKIQSVDIDDEYSFRLAEIMALYSSSIPGGH